MLRGLRKKRNIIGIGVCAALFVVGVFLNQKYEIIAFHPFGCIDGREGIEGAERLRVMTWNVHCPNGADSVRQQRIADLILQENADFILLNEYYPDSCMVLDSLLNTRYSYTGDYQIRRRCGDIFYSKRKTSNSKHISLREREPYRSMKKRELPDSIRGKHIGTIRATIAFAKDSVQIFGLHMMSNSGDGSAIINGVDSLKKMDSFYHRYLKAQEKRCFQAKWTKVFVEESKHPVIVMGDMNDFNCSAPLDYFTSCGLKDSWWEGGTGYGCTFHTGWMRLRIDHIFHSEGLKLCDIKVIPTDLSDHNPIVACFRQ